MNIAKNVYGLDKHAASSLLSDIAAIAGNGMQTIGDLASTTGVFLMGMALLTGGAAGYTAAKLSAHGKQDVQTAKKLYENERLKADLGYLSTKTRQEFDAFKNRQAPRAARVIA